MTPPVTVWNAPGGLIFGALGDGHGRARMLTVTVLIDSVGTGLSALSRGWVDFAVFRFLTGLGVGGVFGLAVALDRLEDTSAIVAGSARHYMFLVGAIPAFLCVFIQLRLRGASASSASNS